MAMTFKQWRDEQRSFACWLEDRDDWIVGPVSHYRDSDLVAESNWDYAVKELGGESETVEIVRFGSSMVGWTEWILIDPSNTEALAKAEEMAERLADYPLLDEDDYGNREHEAVCEQWEGADTRERMEYCRECAVSVFAARRDEVPSAVYNRLRDRTS